MLNDIAGYTGLERVVISYSIGGISVVYIKGGETTNYQVLLYAIQHHLYYYIIMVIIYL
jgi:hypothetical protein